MIRIKFDKAIGPIDLIMPKTSGYVKKFKVRDKIKNNVFLYRRRKIIRKI